MLIHPKKVGHPRRNTGFVGAPGCSPNRSVDVLWMCEIQEYACSRILNIQYTYCNICRTEAIDASVASDLGKY